MGTGHYSFLAIRGHQGDYDYFLTQCLLHLVPRIFIFDKAQVPDSLRLTRSFNASRIMGLVQYLKSQPSEYILPSLVASVDCEIIFEPLMDNLLEIGQLKVPLAARLLIHDGQHRQAAIKQVLTENPTLGNDTIPVMFIPDPNLSRSSRLYADISQSQIQRNLSQQVLHAYDSPVAALVRQMVEEIPLFQGLTELEKTTLSNRSLALFTLSAIYQATQALLNVGKYDVISPEQTEIAKRFWKELGQIIPQWQQAIRRQVTAAYLRQHYVHVHSVTLVAMSMAGHELVTAHPQDWPKRLHDLGKIDWSRENVEMWEGRAMLRGRMSKVHASIQLTAIAIKNVLGLHLTEKERALEQKWS